MTPETPTPPAVPAAASVAKPATGSQVDYVLVALLQAGGAEELVDLEDLAVAAYRLAPHLFRWRRYPEYPSAELTRMAIRHAEAADDQPLFVKGAGGRARRFTAHGLDRARDAYSRLFVGDVDNSAVPLRRPASRDIGRMEKHPALMKWRVGGIGKVSRYDLADLLLCAPSSVDRVFLDRLHAASAAAAQWDRAELRDFLEDAIANTNRILERRDDDYNDRT
jgi:hypothetical protein